MTEWEDGNDTYQGMRHKTTGLPHGIVKLLDLTTSDGNIIEATYIDGKKYGYHRLVVSRAMEVNLTLHGDEEEELGQIFWDKDFTESYRVGDAVDDLTPNDFNPNPTPKEEVEVEEDPRKRVDAILDYWFGFEDDPSIMEDFDRETSLPKAWFKLRLNPDDDTEARIQELFMQDAAPLYDGKYDDWVDDRDGILATILLCDVIMRELYPGQKKAWQHED